jgi:tRNA-Thr(GGU) m(6)t(6)A37 methyltransferase TsaA
MSEAIVVRPIGVVRSPFLRKVEAPRQPSAARDVEGRIELDRSLEHALEDLDGFEHVWVLAWMDRAGGFRSKVRPPRSTKKRGVLATRSPHRPNPIALSVMELVRIEGTVLHVRGMDLLDGTPVLDVKPYVPWADAIPRSRVGWLGEEQAAVDGERPEDPRRAYEVVLAPRAAAQLAWLQARGVSLAPTLRTILEASPHPHPYRRIRRDRARPGGFVLALHEWRVAFSIDATDPHRVHVSEVRTGYRERELDAHPLHRGLTDAELPEASEP